jgi:hypothetical protein
MFFNLVVMEKVLKKYLSRPVRLRVPVKNIFLNVSIEIKKKNLQARPGDRPVLWGPF